MSHDQTETHTPPKQRRDPRRAAVVVVAQGRKPTSPPVRIRIETGTEIVIGRGATLAVTQQGQTLRVDIPDSLMSSTHARITPLLQGHTIADAGSKNGMRVSWSPIDKTVLRDGDWIELGGTLLRYRVDSALASDPLVFEASDDPLATFVPTLADTFLKLRQAATANLPILLNGETGTGKEVVARAVHRLSERSGAFVAVNCGAIASTLLEAELFGHRKGAFSGAIDDRAGFVRAADQGTLMLDEIAELPAAAQAALLRVLQEREVVPVGGDRPIPVDIQLVAATHRDLEAAVTASAFREDLLARLNGVTIRLLPLRERLDDLGIVIGRLLTKRGATTVTIEPEALRALARYHWPRNVRELEMMLGAALAANPERIELAALPDALQDASDTEAAGNADGARKQQLEALLVEHRGNVSHVAQAMGKARSLVQKWLARYGLDASQYRR